MAETDEPAGSRPLWHSRVSEPPSEELWAFTASIDFDRTLAVEDVEGSRAHVRMLADVGLVTGDDASAILGALDIVERELADGSFPFAPTDEDVHTAIERRVTELAGASGGKLHTARSRNDQVATDLRLWLRRRGRELMTSTHELQVVLLGRAKQAGDDVYLPGYTHLQRAQPVLLAHHLLAHFWTFARDIDRWRDCLARADVSPLGAGALAGTSLPIDPDRTADDLGFRRRFENSLDAVSDRDFVAEALFVLALEQVHLSRIGEEFVLWASEEFGFVVVDDAYSTGSSMLPQKKNPDIAELARGKAGRSIGNLTGLLATLKGLPLAYNRDLQEDKEPLFDSVRTCAGTLVAVAGMIDTAAFVAARMRDAADTTTVAATDLAEHLVREGLPFREAHEVVGSLVRESVEHGIPLEELVGRDPRLGPEALTLLEAGTAVRQRTSAGGAGPEPVVAQIVAAEARLATQAEWIT